MPFKQILNDIVNAVPEALGAIIFDIEDGECVQVASKVDEYDIKIIGAYQAIHLKSIGELLLNELKTSDANTFITKAVNMDIISMRIDAEYCVSLILKKDSLMGPAEFILKKNLKELKKVI